MSRFLAGLTESTAGGVSDVKDLNCVGLDSEKDSIVPENKVADFFLEMLVLQSQRTTLRKIGERVHRIEQATQPARRVVGRLPCDPNVCLLSLTGSAGQKDDLVFHLCR